MDRAADGAPDVCRDQSKPTGTRATGVAFAGGTPLTEERERIWSRETPPYGAAGFRRSSAATVVSREKAPLPVFTAVYSGKLPVSACWPGSR
ncbi:hypothetical protein PR202_ga06013 [Eleusine coracana subsp. coracana]|uniref:Uncharacterized protein n=1 Tax=Eleusine coracana subsp. coracana TaxID=191504 RepID=A0AAV5BV09_ELECO|nr:hypothetical protein PR202_ga06013 [Eleusine coracana subsp. coracana]